MYTLMHHLSLPRSFPSSSSHYPKPQTNASQLRSPTRPIRSPTRPIRRAPAPAADVLRPAAGSVPAGACATSEEGPWVSVRLFGDAVLLFRVRGGLRMLCRLLRVCGRVLLSLASWVELSGRWEGIHTQRGWRAQRSVNEFDRCVSIRHIQVLGLFICSQYTPGMI
ncbi:hypothetical protein P153DRAFT_175369 [Dothidotthia symphoricarpi CBS 119687]|uniref:Uncharacterized protein n=1 Tax=Dothidotthia symphoricarpi CBS 119687 TaxID=1392245 RepID=A0A6A6AP76_9PLEO|nr:uncharacterized protein P153DRAFT_175369 [Dothidotthia symphoricarpi CBS 119687]KAF2132855.1 hypothetical protein P153DRAFT_175369 [Dothidotthia symphoricarpi CBS 119687]